MKNKIIIFLEEEYKFLIGLLIFFIISVLPLPYYVIIGGGTTQIDDKIIVEDEYESKGSLNITYVSEMKATPLSYLFAKVFNLELEKTEEVKETNETLEQYEERMKLYLEESYDNAKFVAYTTAGEKIELVNTEMRIIYIYEGADTDLKFNDIILEINGEKINSKEDLSNIVSNTSIKDKIYIRVLRDNKEVQCYAKIISLGETKVIGILLYQDNEYRTDTKIEFSGLKKSSGSSAGLMITLSIYNKLVEEDITQGLKIAGTGTIDENGNIGEIGGIKYKLKAAVKGKADIFVAPTGENYQEVIDLVRENNYNIKIIEAKTFEQVLESIRSEVND